MGLWCLRFEVVRFLRVDQCASKGLVYEIGGVDHFAGYTFRIICDKLILLCKISKFLPE